MLPFIPLLATAAALTPLVSAAHNPNNPHRRALRRAITADASTVNGQTYDFIIAGGGLAGLAIAARLSEWSNQTVLVVEAGGDGSGSLADGRVVQDMIDIPGNSYLHGLTNTAWDWQYDTVPQASALNLVKDWPRGKGLGGSGAVNGMYWNRGNRENYEAWKTLNPGADEDWGWDEVNRCIMKAENWTAARTDQVSDHGMNLDAAAHGTSGAIQAGFAQYMFDIVSAWTPSMAALGLSAIDGASGTTHGSYFCPLTLNPSNMTRSDSKAGYIDGLAPRDNLVILTGQQVTQITFNGTNDADGNILASGISFQPAAGGTAYTANARKEVILSSGTVGSPQILQLSGIGPAAQLATAGVESRLDLPVGYNLQDHITATMYFSTPAGTLTWNNLSSSQALQDSEMVKYKADRTGMWTFVNQAIAFPNMADLLGEPAANYAGLVADQLNATWTETVANKDLPPNVARGLSAQYQIQQSHIDSEVGQVEMLLHLLGPNNNIGIQAALQHPWSRGTIFITSNNAFTNPAINPDYFSVGYDIDIMNNAMQFARRIAQAAPMNDLAVAETQPGAASTGNTLDDYIRTNGVTTYHPIGTCSMLPRDQGGVVDTRLIVYGTGNIRVVDSSIIPLHMSAHTMGTTYGVAEKAAEIIKRKYYEVQEPMTTTSDGESATGDATSAKSTGTAVAGASNFGANAGMSMAAKIGVGAGVGAGVLALLAALIAFCCIRRKKRAAPKTAAWYQGGQEYDQVPKEGQTGEYPMANFTPPQAMYAQHGRAGSVSTMATTDLATRDPMMADRRASSGFGFDGYNYENERMSMAGGGSGAVTPRFDEGGYPAQPPSGAWSPAHQKYTQVNI